MLRFILDAQGKAVPCPDVTTWRAWFETANRELAVATVGPYKIGTYFMGLDHGPGIGDPVLWETTVITDKGEWDQSLTRRYTSQEDAIVGHAAVVSIVWQRLQGQT